MLDHVIRDMKQLHFRNFWQRLQLSIFHVFIIVGLVTQLLGLYHSLAFLQDSCVPRPNHFFHLFVFLAISMLDALAYSNLILWEPGPTIDLGS
ncbi:hypothetical protein ACJX0J_029569, partial [Zea mays]